MVISSVVPSNSAHIVVFSVTVASAGLSLWGHKVYHNSTTALLQTLLYTNLVILNATKLFIFGNMEHMSVASFSLIAVELLMFLGTVVLKFYTLFFPLIKRMLMSNSSERDDGMEVMWTD